MEDGLKVEDSARSKEARHRCVCNSLRMAARAITRLYDDFLRPSELKATQYSALMTVKRRGPITLTQLSAVSVTERTTLTRNLAILEKRGLIRLEQGSDRRERMVSITEQGREALMAAIPLWEKAQAHIEKRLGKARMEGLLKELTEIVLITH